jgi:phosphoglycolate phosphatase
MTTDSGRRFDLVVFDWDGTLMDSAAAIVASVQGACADLGLEVPPAEAARYIIGLGLGDALRHLLPSLEPTRYGELAERYRDHYLARDQQITLFAGAEELVRRMRTAGTLLAVATGKTRRGLDRAFSLTGLGGYFHVSRCADESKSKPDPAMLLEIMRALSADPARTLMVGDTVHDLEMAHSAGVASVAVAYGAHPREALVAARPRAVVGSLAELGAWIETHG